MDDALIDAETIEKNPLINLPLNNDDGKPIQKHPLVIGGTPVTVDDTPVTITIREWTEQEAASQAVKTVETKRRPEFPKELPVHFPSIISPSKENLSDEELSGIQVTDFSVLGDRIKVKPTDDTASLGNAVHDFLALVQGSRPAIDWQKVAQRLLINYGVEDAIKSIDMVEMHQRLTQFIKDRFPKATVRREWPISFRKLDNQIVRGTIDLLLELPEGYIIIDHKTTSDAKKEDAKGYAPQLFAYKEAVEAAAVAEGTHKKVLATLIHMPVIGMIYEVEDI
jgi:ATP-dependent exoDNAse (exonuclease V) beta subunit